jgi:hypothetical protein
MRNHRLVRNRMMTRFAPAVILIAFASSAVAQTTTYSAATETHDSRWNRSTRVQKTRVEANGRTIETQVVEKPSVNGGYTLETATETETIHDGPNTVRVTERWYVPDGNGRRQLSRMIEAETTTVPGRSTTTTRTRYDSDMDGHVQAMERETEESTALNASTNQTVSTVFLRLGGVFVPVQKTVTEETRKDNGVTDVRRTVSLGDHNGQALIPTVMTHTEEKPTAGRSSGTREERVSQSDAGMTPGEGQMSLIQRSATQEWKDSEGQEHSVAETYSMFSPGIAPDRELHMSRRVSSVRQVTADGASELIEETADINPGAKTDPPRLKTKMIEITGTGPDGQFEIQTTFEAPNSSGAMQPFWIGSTKGFERGTD